MRNHVADHLTKWSDPYLVTVLSKKTRELPMVSRLYYQFVGADTVESRIPNPCCSRTLFT